MQAKRHELGRVELQHGFVLPDAQLTYTTFGTLSPDGANAVLFPTWFTGQHPQVEWLIGPGKALDPAKYFIVVVNILGNGQSSSPSNTKPPFDRMRFPNVSILDNVKLQRRLLWDVLGVRHLALVVGRSMGAQLAFQWGSVLRGRRGSHPADLRFCTDVAAQLHLPRCREGGADE